MSYRARFGRGAGGLDADHADEVRHQPGAVEGAHALGEHAHRELARARLRVRARGADRVVDVGDGGHLARQGGPAADARHRVVRLAVEAHVVLVGHQDRERMAALDAAEVRGALLRVAHHDPPLVALELARLVQHVERDLELADVVQERGEPDGVQPRPLDAERARLGQGEQRDVHRVHEGVVVVRLERGQRQDLPRGPLERVHEAPHHLLEAHEAAPAVGAELGERVARAVHALRGQRLDRRVTARARARAPARAGPGAGALLDRRGGLRARRGPP